MNIHFEDKDLFEQLKRESLVKVKVGSHLYGMETDESDVDYLYIYLKPENMKDSFIWEHHQLQYKEDGVDHNFVDLHTFIRNILTGDSTINFEVLHSEELRNSPLSHLYHIRREFYSFNMIRSYLGLARRDIKQAKNAQLGINNKKLHHAMRGYHSALYIIEGRYSNQFNATLHDTLFRAKIGLTKRSADELADIYEEQIDGLREAVKAGFDQGRYIRMMEVDNMKALDEWIYDFKSKLTHDPSSIDLDIFYNALEKGIKY